MTHLDDQGLARMVDVSAKAVTAREAVAEAVAVGVCDAVTVGWFNAQS